MSLQQSKIYLASGKEAVDKNQPWTPLDPKQNHRFMGLCTKGGLRGGALALETRQCHGAVRPHLRLGNASKRDGTTQDEVINMQLRWDR